MKRYFKGTVKCGFCGRELTADEIKDYWADYQLHSYDYDTFFDEEQCPYCGYHSSLVEDEIDPLECGLYI